MALDICRACLSTNRELKSLDDIIRQAFTDLIGIFIKKEDFLPKTICIQCHKMIQDFIEFKNIIIKNHNYLLELNKDKILSHNNEAEKKLFSQCNIKTEPSEEIEAIYLDTKEGIVQFEDDTLSKVKKEKKVKVKELKKRSKERPKHSPRKRITIDSDKITTIRLERDEQLLRQREKANKNVNKDMPYKCERCFKGFNYDRKLKSHIEQYHKPDSKFECGICTRTLRNSASLTLHMQKHEFVYECNVCKASFMEKRRAIQHYGSAHEGIEPRYPCKMCDRVFKNKNTLTSHVRCRHAEVTSRPRCDQCEKTFATIDSYNDHMLIHTGEKNYSCATCGATFRLRHALNAHTHVHSTARAYRCRACDAAFKTRSAYVHHCNTARGHVTDEVKAKNTCPTCSRQFSTRYALRKHVVAVHEGGGARGAKKPRGAKEQRGGEGVKCICHYCGKGFVARNALERHIKRHKEDKVKPKRSNKDKDIVI